MLLLVVIDIFIFTLNTVSGLRIRLPLLKRKVPELSCNTKHACYSGRAMQAETSCKYQPPSNTDRACSSGRTDHLAKKPKTVCELPKYEERACSSGRAEKLAEETQTICKNDFGSRIQKSESQFEDLLENWKFPPLLMENPDFDNQEWLFGRKEQCNKVAKQNKDIDNSIAESSGLWPRACYLPAVDLYALPYAIPY